MAPLIHSLTSTAKSVITLPLHIAKQIARRHADAPQPKASAPAQPPTPPQPRTPPEPRTPPVRRTAEEAVARERASATATSSASSAARDDEKYDEFDEPLHAGNAAAADGAGSDSGRPGRKPPKKKPDTQPLLDASKAKAVLRESETMRKAADPRKD